MIENFSLFIIEEFPYGRTGVWCDYFCYLENYAQWDKDNLAQLPSFLQ
jgi:hypothetical protein